MCFSLAILLMRPSPAPLQFPIDEAHRRVPKAGPKINGEPDTVDNLDLLTESKVCFVFRIIGSFAPNPETDQSFPGN